jgi:hypothetical protein
LIRPADLLPELRAWNDGRGISPLTYVFCMARSDTATAYLDLFWPEFVVFEEYVFRAGFEEAGVRDWQSSQNNSRRNVEAATNYLDIGSLFQNSNELKSATIEDRAKLIRATLADIYTVKLERDFPDRLFHIELIDTVDDLALTFYQA